MKARGVRCCHRYPKEVDQSLRKSHFMLPNFDFLENVPVSLQISHQSFSGLSESGMDVCIREGPWRTLQQKGCKRNFSVPGK